MRDTSALQSVGVSRNKIARARMAPEITSNTCGAKRHVGQMEDPGVGSSIFVSGHRQAPSFTSSCSRDGGILSRGDAGQFADDPPFFLGHRLDG